MKSPRIESIKKYLLLITPDHILLAQNLDFTYSETYA